MMAVDVDDELGATSLISTAPRQSYTAIIARDQLASSSSLHFGLNFGQWSLLLAPVPAIPVLAQRVRT
jgi:hypothetical protein